MTRNVKKMFGWVATAVLLCAMSGAHADPLLTGVVTNNGQVVGPNDSVTFTVRIDNIGDAAFSSDWDFAVGAGAIPDNYQLFMFPTTGYPAFDITPLAAGGSFEFDLFILIPPAGGVALGPYVTGNPFSMHFENGTLVTFGFANWVVVASAAPEPSTLALLGLALAGLAASRRRKLK